ncbi:unnamed protein product [Laminaria digitata]
MRRKLVSCPWAALAFVFLLCHSSALSMAIRVHQMHQLRPVSTAVRNCCKLGLKPAFFSFSDAGRAELPRRKGLRRGRASALHSDAQERMPFPASHLQPSPLLLTVMDRALPFGRCIGVALPSALTTDTLRAAEEELMPEEVSYCLALPPTLQQLGFLGGRLAIRRALEGMSEAAAAATSAILHNKDGAPVLPKGVSASISHKHHMAVALVQSGCEGHLGVDIELPAVRRRGDLRRRVLTPRECGSLGGVDGVSAEEEVLLRFSVKEAVYKAAHPFLHRPLGFKDVEVQPKTGGGCDVQTSTAGAWGDLKLSAGWIHLPDVLGQPLFLSYCKAVDGNANRPSRRGR